MTDYLRSSIHLQKKKVEKKNFTEFIALKFNLRPTGQKHGIPKYTKEQIWDQQTEVCKFICNLKELIMRRI